MARTLIWMPGSPSKHILHKFSDLPTSVLASYSGSQSLAFIDPGFPFRYAFWHDSLQRYLIHPLTTALDPFSIPKWHLFKTFWDSEQSKMGPKGLTMPHTARKNHFWKAPTTSSHQKLILGYLLTRSLRSRGWKCAQLSAPVQGPTISVSCKLGIFGKPQPVALTRS